MNKQLEIRSTEALQEDQEMDLDDEGDEEEFEEPEEEEEIPREIRDWHELANRGPRTRLIQVFEIKNAVNSGSFSAWKTRHRS